MSVKGKVVCGTCELWWDFEPNQVLTPIGWWHDFYQNLDFCPDCKTVNKRYESESKGVCTAQTPYSGW